MYIILPLLQLANDKHSYVNISNLNSTTLRVGQQNDTPHMNNENLSFPNKLELVKLIIEFFIIRLSSCEICSGPISLNNGGFLWIKYFRYNYVRIFISGVS